MKHCGTKYLETDRLILRRFKKEDAEAMYNNWASDNEVTKYLTWPPHSNQEVSQSILDGWVNSYSDDSFYQWAIVLKDNGDKPIGSISAVDIKEKTSMAHIGYCIGRAWSVSYTHLVGSLMLKYNGGGHKKVGTCQFSNENMDTELPKMLEELKQLSNQ